MSVDLADLVDLGEFELRFGGAVQSSFLGHLPCAWFEWHWGEPASPELEAETGVPLASWSSYTAEADLVAHTPRGELELSWRSLRPYLAPAFDQTWTRGKARGAPKVVRADLRNGPVRAVEYCLATDRSYYARVNVETYMLPPEGPGEPPGEGRNAVLVVSDVPFVEGRPPHSITPTFRGWSY